MDYRNLMFQLATSFINLPTSQTDKAIKSALKQTVEYFKFDRGHIFSFDLSAATFSNTYEFCSPGIPRQRGNLQNIHLSFIAEWKPSFDQGEAVIITDLSILSAGPFRTLLETQQIKSLIFLPLTDKDDCKGYIGFDSVKEQRHISADEVQQLTLLAILLVNLNHRIDEKIRLRKKQRFLEAVIDVTRAGTWEWNIQTGETVLNNRWAEMLGYQLAELGPVNIATWHGLTHPDDLIKAEEQLQWHLSGNSDFYRCELRMRHNKGHWVWVERIGKVYEWTTEGLPLLVAGTHQNVSWRKKLQNTLIQNVVKYRTLFEHALEGLFLHDLDGKIVAVNKAAILQTGYSRKELLGMTIFDLNKCHLSPDTLLATWEHLKKGEVIATETEHRHRDGHSFPVEIKVCKLSGRGDRVAILTHVRDISLQKNAEAALLQSELFYRQTLESIPAIPIISQADGFVDYIGQQGVKYTGIALHELLGNGWHHQVHPADQQYALVEMKDAITNQRPFLCEFRVRRFDGVYEWFRFSANPLEDNNGKILKWFGIGLNVNCHKEMSELLFARETLLRTITDNVRDSIFLLDQNCRMIYLNPACVKNIKIFSENPAITSEEIKGKSIADLIFEKNIALKMLQDDIQVMTSGVSQEVETAIPTTNGTYSYLISRVPLRDNNGQITGIVGISRDITKLKETERLRLAALERQRDTLVREVHHRIKNHLQGVTGMLYNAVSDNPELAVPVAPLIRQIRSIATVYGIHSLSGNKPIQLMDLIRSIINGFPESPEINLSAEVDPSKMALRTEDTVPTALIINELLTNATKHLHHIDPERPVKVCVKKLGKGLCLEITSGPAYLPVDFDFNMISTLGTGLELVKALLPNKGAQLTYKQRGDEVTVIYCFEIGDGT